MRTAYLRLVWVYAALLALLAFTIGSSLIPLGVLNPVINLGVAIAKAALIFWFYMELRTSAGLVRIFALAGFGWISLLFILGFSDWLTR